MLQHHRLFALQPSTTPGIEAAAIFQANWDRSSPGSIREIAERYSYLMSDLLSAKPVGSRTLYLRRALYDELYMYRVRDDVVKVFETNSVNTNDQIRMYRPTARELRRRGITLDGIFLENEGGFQGWDLTVDQFRAIFRSKRAVARMPAAVRRGVRPEFFEAGNPKFFEAMAIWNQYAFQVACRQLRRVTVESGLFRLPAVPGGPLRQPPTTNFWWQLPTWPAFDQNNWRYISASVDGRSSFPQCYMQLGNRYRNFRHDHRWNVFVDHINLTRSCMVRSNAAYWPCITWPRYCNEWLWEQMVAHMARTGVNWANGNAYWYWKEHYIGDQQDQKAAEIFGRHDQPFPAQRNLPRVEMDVDVIETAGFRTTYEDFLANVVGPGDVVPVPPDT